MFSRRHPFLYFILIFSGIWAVAVVFTTFFLYLSAGEKSAQNSREKIGIIEITGAISTSDYYVKALKKFRENDTVKAVVLRINSPGGAVAPTQEIYAEVIKTIEEKPVIASFGAIAASGGYYIASAASRIVTNPGTLTGSIGVIMGFTNMEELMDKIGLKPMIIKSGDYKAMGSPFKEMTTDERNYFEALTHDIHMQFIRHVAEGRKMDIEDVTEIADGRVFTGKSAVELGLCDKIGNMEDAVSWAVEISGTDEKAQRIYPEKETDYPLLDKLIKNGIYSITYYLNEQISQNKAPMLIYHPSTP